MCWPVSSSSEWTIHFRNTPNAKNLCTMFIQLFSWCGLLARLAPWFSALRLTVRIPFFRFNADTIQKNLYFFIVESEVYMYKIAFPCLLASIHMAPDFLPFETLPSIWTFRNGHWSPTKTASSSQSPNIYGTSAYPLNSIEHNPHKVWSENGEFQPIYSNRNENVSFCCTLFRWH